MFVSRYKKVIKGTPKRITVIPRPAPTMLKHLMVESWPVWVSSSSYPKINHTYSPPPYYLRVSELIRCLLFQMLSERDGLIIGELEHTIV